MTMVGCRTLALIATALSLAGCGGGEGPAVVMERDRFVAANVAMRTLPANATDAERAAVLKKHRVSEKELKAWVNAHARDPRTLSLAWEEIVKKVDSLTTQRPGPPPGGGPPPGAVSPSPRRELPPEIQIRKDSILRERRLGRPNLPPPGTPRPAAPPSSGAPDPRIAPVQAPVTPARPPRSGEQ